MLLQSGRTVDRLIGYYPSALHRVVVPAGDSVDGAASQTPSRYSIPYFVLPSFDAIIAPQASRVAAEGRTLYEPIAFRQYSRQMFDATQTQDKKSA